jgi:putative endopeptidase
MDRRIDKLDWMSAETKVKAHAKLAAFTPKIGYPSQWRDMSGLVDRPRRPARQCDALEPVRLCL